MDPSPLGPTVAVAVTYCVPAVEEAWVGPLRLTVGCVLSTLIVSAGEDTFRAALVADSTNCWCPLPLSETVGDHVCGLAHCCHEVWIGASPSGQHPGVGGLSRGCPFSDADIDRIPERSLAVNESGHWPRSHRDP